MWNLTLPLTFDPPPPPILFLFLLVKEIFKLPKLKIKTRRIDRNDKRGAGLRLLCWNRNTSARLQWKPWSSVLIRPDHLPLCSSSRQRMKTSPFKSKYAALTHDSHTLIRSLFLSWTDSCSHLAADGQMGKRQKEEKTEKSCPALQLVLNVAELLGVVLFVVLLKMSI